MTDDDVVTRIGEHVREEQRDDVRYERIARGEAGPEELAELERAAKEDSELALRLEGSRPLEPAAVDRIVGAVSKPLAEKPAPKSPAAGAPPKAPAAKREPSPWKRRIVTLAGPLVLAAGMILYVTSQRGPRLPELPPYSVTVSGEQAMRGSAGASTRLRIANAPSPSARYEIVLRPATAPEGKVVAFAFTLGSAPGEPTPLEAKVEIAPEGSVRLTGASRALAGATEIRVVIGAPQAIGKFDDALARAAAGKGDDNVRVLTVAIDRD